MKINLRRIIFLALLVFLTTISSIVKAQWNPNTYVNLQISSLNTADLQSIPTTDGKTWIAFYSQNGSNYDMRAQLIDANGNKLLGPDGILVSNQTSGSAIYVFNVCLDASNNLIIAMQDSRTSPMQAVVYKIAQDGTHLWSASGVILGAGLSPYPYVLTTGETVVVWNESTSNTLQLQKITSTGTLAWGTSIPVLVGTTKTTRGQVIANTGGKFTLVYQKKGVGISTTLYSQMYDNSGSALYTPLQISNYTSSGARYYSVVADGDTTYFGYYVAQGSRFNSYLQRINPGGTIPWGMNGSNFSTAISSADPYQQYTSMNFTPGSNYIWSVCDFSNTLQSTYGIYVQKFLKTTGARQFTDAAKNLYPISASFDQCWGKIAMVNDAPMFMATDVNYKIYAIRLDANGNFAWTPNRIELSSTTAAAGVPKMRYGFTPVGPNKCAGIWTENRASGGYIGYAQGITIGGLIGIKVYTQGNVPATITTSGGTLQVIDSIFPTTANQNVSWSLVGGTGLATINSTGLVTAIVNGTVWAKATSVADPSLKDSLLITMTNQLVSVPAIVTVAASPVTSFTATLNGTVSANYASTAVSFQWGTSTLYGNTIAANPPTVTTNTNDPVSANLTGLVPGTVYHFRAVGTNIAGTTYGNDLAFTATLTPPLVITNPAINVLNTSADLNGSVNAINLSTTVSFEYGTSTSYGFTAPAGTVNGYVATPVTTSISGLTWGTIYHFRCKGVNSMGTTYGSDMVFTSGCPYPVAPGVIAGLSVVCANTNNVAYSVPAIPNATNYNWALPAGATIAAGAGTNSITVNYSSTAVSGNITVTGTNNCASGPTGILGVNVNALPSPAITGPASRCYNSTGAVYTTQSGMNNYLWTVIGGTITAGAGTNAITVTWNTLGNQSVSVNYTNTNGCTAASPVLYPVVVVPLPVPTITGPATACESTSYLNYSTEPGMTNYTWAISPNSGTISISNTNVVTVFWTSPGQKYISVTYTNQNGCSAASPTTYNVTVNPLPGTPGTITGTSTVCAGTTIGSYVVAAVSNADSYTWSLPAGAAIATGAGTRNITVNFSANAVSGNVSVAGVNACGPGQASANFPVTVSTGPPAPGAITGPAVACQGSTGIVYSVAAVTGATSYSWTLPAGASISSGGSTNSITVNFGAAAASGTIMVNAVNGCGNGASTSLAVTVNPKPAAAVITLFGNLLSSSVASGNQWYRDGVAISGSTAQYYFVIQDGTFTDIVNVNGCSSNVSNSIIVNHTAVGDADAEGINVYPNPNSGAFWLSINSDKPAVFEMSVLNSIGAVVYKESKLSVDGTFKHYFDLQGLPSGMYTIFLRSESRKIVRKFIVNK